MDRREPIPIYPVRIELETLGEFRAPEYAGALFRGGFGKYFRELSCRTRAPACVGCSEAQRCAYSVVFETPVDAARFPVLRKYPHAPHPFVLAPGLNGGHRRATGEAVTLHLTLIGPGADYLPHFLVVFEGMGRGGSFGGRFRIKRVVSECGVEVVYDGDTRRIADHLPAWRGAAGLGRQVNRLRLEFVTPLRMRTDGRYNSTPTFSVLTQTLLRRISLLRALYGDGVADTAWTSALLKAADEAEVEAAEWRPYQWGRKSGRQQRWIQMDGVLGSITVRGELTELSRWYRLGEWVHMGNGTSMGLGRYHGRYEPHQ